MPDDDYNIKATLKVDADTSEAEKKIKELPKLFNYLFDTVYNRSKYTKFDIEEVVKSFEKLDEKQREVNNQFGRLFRRRHRVDIDSSDLDKLYHKFRALRTALTVNAKEIGLSKDVMADLARFEVLLNKVASGKIKNKKALSGIKDEAEAIITQLTLLQKGKISPEEFKKGVLPILRSLPLPKEYVPEQPATLLEANAGFEGLYDVLKKSKATRFQRTLDLFIASVFDAISASFDKGVATVVSKGGADVTSYLKTQQIGRMIGASMVNPQSFATIFAKIVESETPLAEEFMNIAEKVGLKIQQSPEGRIEAVGGNIRGFIIELMKRSARGKVVGAETDKALLSGLAVGYLQSLTIGVSGLMAKVGVIGVIVNKILEVFMRLMALSGSLQATVKMIGLFIQMTLKPLADLLASLFMPLVMMLMPVMSKLLRWWNDLYKVWMKNAMHDRKLSSAQMASALAGFLKGGLWGGLAGALAPMMTYYGYKKSGWEAKTVGAIGLGLESITLTGDLKVFSVSSLALEGAKEIATNGNIVVKGAKTIIEWATGNKGSGAQPSPTTGGGSGGGKTIFPPIVTGSKGAISKAITASFPYGVALGYGATLGYFMSKWTEYELTQAFGGEGVAGTPLGQTLGVTPSGSFVTPSTFVEMTPNGPKVVHKAVWGTNAPQFQVPSYPIPPMGIRYVFEQNPQMAQQYLNGKLDINVFLDGNTNMSEFDREQFEQVVREIAEEVVKEYTQNAGTRG